MEDDHTPLDKHEIFESMNESIGGLEDADLDYKKIIKIFNTRNL